MRRPRWWFVVLSFLVVATSVLLQFAVGWASGGSAAADSTIKGLGLTPVDTASYNAAHSGFSGWAAEHVRMLSVMLLALALFTAAIDFLRTYFQEKHAAKPAILRLLNMFTMNQFPERELHSRITLFKPTSGWMARVWLSWLRPSQRDKRRFMRSGVRRTANYLMVYSRGDGGRHLDCPVAWRIGDDSGDFEGVAGRIWDEGGFLYVNAGAVPTPTDRAIIANARSMDELPAHLIAYAKETSIDSIASYQAVGTFGKHFCGSVVKVNGKRWGVLIVDSTEPDLPFSSEMEAREALGDLAVILGKIVA